MKTPLKSLTIVLGTTLAVFASSQAASAALFNWSYTSGNGVYTGMIEGDIQIDNNTVNVTRVFMSQLNGNALPDTPYIFDTTFTTGTTGIVSLDGLLMNLSACTDLSCLNGGIFIGDLGDPAITFSTTFPTAIYDEPFDSNKWTLTEKTFVPEPSLTLALVGLGLSALAKSRLKKN